MMTTHLRVKCHNRRIRRQNGSSLLRGEGRFQKLHGGEDRVGGRLVRRGVQFGVHKHQASISLHQKAVAVHPPLKGCDVTEQRSHRRLDSCDSVEFGQLHVVEDLHGVC